MYHKTYRSCAVPLCKNTSKKTPLKLFVSIPKTEKMRSKWLSVARRDPTALSAKSTIYYCEDHFNLPEDMENYMQYHVMGTVTQVRMKPDVIPTRFACQLDRRKRTTIKARPYFLKKQRKGIVEDCERDMAEKSKAEKREPVGVTLETVQDLGKIEIKEEAITVDIEYEEEPAPTTSSTATKWANKSVQVYRTHKFRSKAVQTESKPAHGSKWSANTCIEIENDMENYVKYKLVGGRLKLKQGIVPHIFKCQEDNEDRPLCSAVKKRGRIQRVKKLLIKDEPQTLDVTVDPGDMLACCLYEPGLEDSSSSANTDQLLEAPNKINTGVEKSHEGSATPSEDSEVEIQRLAKKLTAALTTISVLTKKNGDLTKKNQELSKKVAALEQKNKLMGRQQAVLQKLNEGLARRSLLVEQRSERLRARIAAHGITDAVTDDDEGEEEEPRPPPDTHPHPESDTEETETADEDWAMSQDSSPEQTGTTSKIRPKPLNDLLRVSHQKNVKIVNVLAKSKRRMPRKATNTTLGKRSRHNSVTSKNSRIETCVEPLVETSCVGSEQADPLSLMTPDEIKIEDDIKIEEPDIEEYIAATKQI